MTTGVAKKEPPRYFTRSEAGMGFKVIEVQPTPNPNALKFVLGQVISEKPASFFDPSAAKDHPVASRIFAVAGVTSVLLLADFVTVNKRPAAKWAAITAKVKKILSESP